jgi:magnesium transporter
MGKKRRSKIRKKGLPPGSLVYTGNRLHRNATIRTVRYNDSRFSAEEQYPQNITPDENEIIWVDIRSLTDIALIERIGRDFHIHPLVLEDVLNTQQRAKLEEYDNGLFFVLHNIRFNAELRELHSEQIAIFAGKRFVVSFQEDEDDTFATLYTRTAEGIGKLRKKGTDYLTYTIIDNIVDNYYEVLDEIDGLILEIEHELHTEGATVRCKAGIFELKGLAAQLRHRLLPLRDALNRFYHLDSEWIDDGNRVYLRDVADHVAQILDSVDNYREMIAGAEAFYQAEVGNRLNNVMRLLTIISTIFIPLSFIAGVYGMNFEYMPELQWRYGYFMVLSIMLSMMLVMLGYFRWKKWI